MRGAKPISHCREHRRRDSSADPYLNPKTFIPGSSGFAVSRIVAATNRIAVRLEGVVRMRGINADIRV